MSGFEGSTTRERRRDESDDRRRALEGIPKDLLKTATEHFCRGHGQIALVETLSRVWLGRKRL